MHWLQTQMALLDAARAVASFAANWLLQSTLLIAAGLAVVGTFIILKVCDALVGVRADNDEEEQGLDLSQHGEEGYFLEA